jgi:hypothetical protein
LATTALSSVQTELAFRTAGVRRRRLRRTLIALLSEPGGSTSASSIALVPVDPVTG